MGTERQVKSLPGDRAGGGGEVVKKKTSQKKRCSDLKKHNKLVTITKEADAQI